MLIGAVTTPYKSKLSLNIGVFLHSQEHALDKHLFVTFQVPYLVTREGPGLKMRLRGGVPERPLAPHLDHNHSPLP
jgi:hypothetical protein